MFINKKSKQYLLIIPILMGLFSLSAFSQSIVGVWETIDDETNKPESHIEIYQKNGKIYGKIIKLLIKPTNEICIHCTDDRKNKPLIGLEIIRNMEKDDDNEWEDGEITYPKNGKIYSCEIKMENPNKLKVTGYIGFSFIKRTQYWHRVSK